MAESSLSLNFTDFKKKVGFFLGYGLGDTSPGVYTDAQTMEVVNDCVRGGLEQVVKPPILPGEQNSYDWSWMRPVATVALPSGASSVVLPDDFGGIEGKVFLTDSASDSFMPIQVVNPEFILAKQAAYPTFTGPPGLVAVQWTRGTTANAGQRAQLMVWPTTDQAYTLTLQYYFLQDALNGTNPWPPGGAFLAQTINASCLAYAELHVNYVSRGPMYQAFMESLAASIAADRRNLPQTGGYNGDRSDEVFAGRSWDYLHRPVAVTYSGS